MLAEVSCAQTLVPASVASAIRQALDSRVLRGGQASPAVAELALRLPLATSETAWQSPVKWFKTRL